MRKALPLTLTSSGTVVAMLDQSIEPDDRPVANIRAQKGRLAVGRAAGAVAETGSPEPGSQGRGECQLDVGLFVTVGGRAVG